MACSTLHVAVQLGLWGVLVAGCDPSPPGSDGGDGDAWLAVGRSSEAEFQSLRNGDTLDMVEGGQGLLMFPLPIRGGDFSLSDDPDDYSHPDTPILDMNMTIEGHAYAPGGYFTKVANYPIPFEILDDGSYEFVYVTLFVPDDELEDVCEVHGLDAHIAASIRPYDRRDDPVETSVDVVIAVPNCP